MGQGTCPCPLRSITNRGWPQSPLFLLSRKVWCQSQGAVLPWQGPVVPSPLGSGCFSHPWEEELSVFCSQLLQVNYL